ncbi:energy transducer TonB [Lysobacter olei]
MAIALLAVTFSAAAGSGVESRPNVAIDPSAMAVQANPAWDVAPKLIQGKTPIYPVSQLVAGKSGASIIVYTIGTDGKAKDILIEQTDDQRYANHVRVVLKDWSFHPATKAGIPVEARVRQTFKFQQQ